jgi:predicted kinase
MKVLYIIRGLPGSGKSTLAKNMRQDGFYGLPKYFEADMFFTGPDGAYKFDASKLSEAHQKCKLCTEAEMLLGKNVTVSNTFTKYWEMAVYFEMATRYGYAIKIIHCKKRYNNIHGVSNEIIDMMELRMESDNFIAEQCANKGLTVEISEII